MYGVRQLWSDREPSAHLVVDLLPDGAQMLSSTRSKNHSREDRGSQPGWDGATRCFFTMLLSTGGFVLAIILKLVGAPTVTSSFGHCQPKPL